MTDPVQEQLSALMDGELHAAELDLLLRRLQRDSQLRQSLGRYALISESLRGQRLVAASGGFAAGVAAAIAADTPAQARPVRLPVVAPRWLRPAAGMAVAAGVAAVAVMVLQPQLSPDEQEPQLLAGTQVNETTSGQTGEATLAAANPSYIVPTSTTPTVFIPATRLTNYVVAHSEYATPLARRTVLSGVLSAEEGAAANDVTDVVVQSEDTVGAVDGPMSSDSPMPQP